jgi:4-amino-4-deoxy-L-arabinose transferase-like glycosyltransferase
LALFIRFEYIKHTEAEIPIRGDAYQYYAYGFNLRHFGVFSHDTDRTQPIPDAFRSPGYPLLIAALIFIRGDTGFYSLLLYVQAILSALLVIFTFFLGVKLLPRWAALLACIWVVFSPHLISITSYVLGETLFAVVLLLAVISFYEALRYQKMSGFVIAALFFGTAYLINETVLLLPACLAAAAGLIAGGTSNAGHRPLRRRRLVAFVLLFCLVPAGWLYRSSQLPADAPRGSQRALATLSHGAYPGFVHTDPTYKNYPYREDPRQPEFSRSLSGFVGILWARFKQRPLRYLSWYLFEKPYYFWRWGNLQSYQGTEVPKGSGDVYFYPVKTSLYMTSRLADFSRQCMRYLHPVIVLLSLVSIPLAWIDCRHRQANQDVSRTPVFMLATGVYYTLVYSIFAPWPRYSVPLRPLLYICAAWSAAAIGNRIFKRVKNRLTRHNVGREA